MSETEAQTRRTAAAPPREPKTTDEPATKDAADGGTKPTDNWPIDEPPKPVKPADNWPIDEPTTSTKSTTSAKPADNWPIDEPTKSGD